MNIIIPMAGSGARFVAEGYTDPKPFIKVVGRRILEYVLDMYDRDLDKFVFIVSEAHYDYSMHNALHDMVKNAEIVPIPTHKKGPVYTVLGAENYVESSEPCIISYCDNPVKWDYDKFKAFVGKGIDGCIVSHTGFHPHTLSSTLFAYSKTDAQNRVSEIKEKSCYTNNRFAEHASSGVYYFKHGHYVKKYFRQAINENVCYNGEYYVTLVFNLMIKDNLSVYSFLNDQVLAFGTPKEVRNYEAWQTILNGGQVTDEETAKLCYSYWKNLNDNKQC